MANDIQYDNVEFSFAVRPTKTYTVMSDDVRFYQNKKQIRNLFMKGIPLFTIHPSNDPNAVVSFRGKLDRNCIRQHSMSQQDTKRPPLSAYTCTTQTEWPNLDNIAPDHMMTNAVMILHGNTTLLPDEAMKRNLKMLIDIFDRMANPNIVKFGTDN